MNCNHINNNTDFYTYIETENNLVAMYDSILRELSNTFLLGFYGKKNVMIFDTLK